MGTASRPTAGGPFEIESADDFILGKTTSINNVSFTGLLVGGDLANVNLSQTVLEIYRVFPLDSTNPPSGNVPTRVNSPSDVEFIGRAAADFLLVTGTQINPSFTAANSVTPGGIHPSPNQTTLGNGPQTGEEVVFDITLSNPFVLPPDHYFW